MSSWLDSKKETTRNLISPRFVLIISVVVASLLQIVLPSFSTVGTLRQAQVVDARPQNRDSEFPLVAAAENNSTKRTQPLPDVLETPSAASGDIVTKTHAGPIYFNIFLPPNNPKNALQIVREQIWQRNQRAPTSPITYTLIGNNDETSRLYLDEVCQPQCTQRAYLEVGNEVDTLQAMWEYCQDHPSQVVTYLHDKGSFRPARSNTRARKRGTKAALECQGLLVDASNANDVTNANETRHNQEQCTVCGARFYVLPLIHVRANMWSAKCSYIRKLIAPKDYESTVRSMYETTVNHPVLGPTKFACLQPQKHDNWSLGLERYAYERWAFNHPDMVPCDAVRPDTDNQTSTPQLSLAPRSDAASDGFGSKTRTSWERLEGRIFEWEYLYRQRPPKTSWVWKYYEGFGSGTEEYRTECSKLHMESVRALPDNVTTTLNVSLWSSQLVSDQDKSESYS